MKKEEIKAKNIKTKFMIYFDGFGPNIEATKNTSNTFTMGVCKLEYRNADNTLEVHLRRPGLLIGTYGRTIDAISKYLDCKIHIVEVNLQNDINTNNNKIQEYAEFCIECDRKGMKPLQYTDYLKLK